MAILQDLVTETYRVLGEASDNSESYDVNTVVIPSINRLTNKICKGQVKNLITAERYRAGDLPFLRRYQFYNRIQEKRTRAEIISGATTIELSNVDGLPQSGQLFIQGSIVSYTNIMGTTLGGVTGVLATHKAGEKVYPLYVIPDNTSKPFTLFRVDRNEQPYELTYNDIRYGVMGTAGRSIVQNNEGEEYLLVRGLNNGDLIHLYYYLDSVDIVNNDDTIVIPDPRALRMIPPLVAGELLRETEEEDVAQAKLIKGYAELSDFYEYYINQNKVHHRTIGVRGANFNLYGYGSYGKRRRNIHSSQIVQ